MEDAAPDGAPQASPAPAEADWPPELRLPPPPPPADPPPLLPPPGTDDPHFLSSIIGDAAAPPPPPPPPLPLGQKRKRGRPPKRKDGAGAASGAGAVVPAQPPARAARRREDEEEVVCFICFDGGNLVVCDRRWVPVQRALLLPLRVDCGNASWEFSEALCPARVASAIARSNFVFSLLRIAGLGID